MNPYLPAVAEYARFAREGRTFPLGQFPPCPRPTVPVDAPVVLVISPHPDDEVIIGGLALRLLRESRWRVVNVAVTLGSRQDRKAGRLAELRGCCACIGFELETTAPEGLDRIQPKTRESDPAHWAVCVAALARVLLAYRPRVILFPHDRDWNSTHMGTHQLVVDALRAMPVGFECDTVETEFWGAMWDPNLMVELSAEQVADLITALTFHVEEVRRNPYHLSLPAWMVDNVRRGAELVGGQGGASPDFTFATLYRRRRWRGGQFEAAQTGGRNLALGDDLAAFFGGGG